MNKHASPVKQTLEGSGRQGLEDAYGVRKVNTATYNRTKCIGESE